MVGASAEEIMEVSDQLDGLADKERKITDLLLESPTHEKITMGQRLQQLTSNIRSAHVL